MKHVFIWVNAVLISMALGGSHLQAVASNPWNGSVKKPDLNGKIYVIKSPEELAWIAQQSQTTDFSGYTVRLEDDLDLGGTLETPPCWTPIGNASKPFNGELDGNIHVIYNLYILSSLFIEGAGLIAETGSAAVIHHLGLGQGQIMTDMSSNIGGFIGINRGKLHHCFTMTQIIAHNGDNVGGLVGTNYGEIDYCYNAGIITDANNHVGGLIGYNKASAVLDNCYNMGYCKGSDHVGALFGRNEAPETQITKVVFDQQLTRMYATGYGANDSILTDNSKYAIEKSYTFSTHSSPFYENPEVEWCYAVHAQLVCFKNHPASWLSGFAITLDANNRPIERAEGVGAPKEGNEPRHTIGLDKLKNNFGEGQWYSSSPDVIYIKNPTDSKAEVTRPCGNQEVILTLTYDKFVKQVYTIVKGYETFDAGIVIGNQMVCWNKEDVKFKSCNNEGKEASGGKDDEQKNAEFCYQYMIIRDTVINEGEGRITYLPMDTFYMTQSAYEKWSMPTDVPGRYAFRRYVHDTKCKTEWTVSKGKDNTAVGRMMLTVLDKFDAGELEERPDTIYGIPQEWIIHSQQDAAGGSETFNYLWKMERSVWNADKRTWDPVKADTKDPLYIDGAPADSAGCRFTFEKIGRYRFTRRVSDALCNTKPIESRYNHDVYVWESPETRADTDVVVVIECAKVEISPQVAVCQTEKSLRIGFETIEGTPTHYDLLFDSVAHKAGFKDILQSKLPANGLIQITLPKQVPLGDFSCAMLIYDILTRDSCHVTPQAFTFSILLDGYVHRKGEDVIFVDNSGAHTEEGLTFVAYQWYRNDEAIDGATGQFYYEPVSLNGFYHVAMTTADGQTYLSCVYEMRASEGVERIQHSAVRIQKVLRNGQLFIVAGEKTYTLFGQEVRL